MGARRDRWMSYGFAASVLLELAGQATTGRADVPWVATVRGTDVLRAQTSAGRAKLDGAEPIDWRSLATTRVSPGVRWLGFGVAPGTQAVLVPVCAGRKRVFVDDTPQAVAPGPLVVDVPNDGRAHRLSIELAVSGYEHRIACGAPPRLGTRATTRDGLVTLTFPSPHAAVGGGSAVVYIPGGHDVRRPAAVLVGLHPWNGSTWTYAAYDTLLTAARAEDVVLLFPSGLGNSLYTAPAEDEALRALSALSDALAVDPDRVTIWGASMGGAGATTVGFHHPDRFAGIISLFGDSRYDLATYVRAILHDSDGAHRVNAFDIVENVRNVPVWLIHGEDDHVSPLAQSAMLARALTAVHFTVEFDPVPGAGHEGRVVSEFAARIVDLAVHARRVEAPRHVSYWSVRPGDTEAYGLRLVRAHSTGDAFFDIERVGDVVHLRSARGLLALRLPRGAFDFAPGATPRVVCDDPDAHDVNVTWDALP